MNGQCYKCSQWPSGEPPYQPLKWSERGQNVLASHNCYSYMLNDLFLVPRKYGKPQPGWHHKIISKNNTYNGIRNLNCSETITGVMKDNPKNLKVLSIKEGQYSRPPPFHYKGILVVSPNNDYHFARQDNRMLKVYSMLIRNGIDKKGDIPFLKGLLSLSRKYIPEIYAFMPPNLGFHQKLRFLYKNSKTWSHKPGATPVTDKDADGRLIFDPLKANWNFSNKPGGINYYKKCCFFFIPMNTHKNTYSTGSPLFSIGASIPTNKTRTNISSTNEQQQIDKRVRRLLRV
jgi:hypothetical protein